MSKLKPETQELLSHYLVDGKFEISEIPEGSLVNMSLSDEEYLALVQSEYGTSITQDVNALFAKIVKEFLLEQLTKRS